MIGKNYMYTALVFFFIAGLMAELMRTQLFNPNGHVVSLQTYNALVTIHGSIMLYLFAGPIAFAGFANYLVPIMIGAPDMAFPRLNSLSYWFYLFGGTTMLFGFLTASGAAAFGWTGYTPLSTATYSPGPGADLWIASVAMVGFSGIFSAVNLVTTIFYLRAPGMTMFRMPLFVWSMLITGILILIAFPVLTAALVMLYADRHFGAHFFTVSGGGVPVMWQNLFWFFGHPEVYILALPFFGMISEVVPVFSRKPIFGYKGMVFATLAIAGLSTGVWAHHMFTTGTVLLPFFSALSLLIAVPTGIKVFTWIATMWGGQVKFNTSMLFAVGFIAAFVMGASPASCWRRLRSTSTRTTPTSWSHTSTRCSSGRRCSRCWRGSTTGIPSSPGGSCTRGSARRTSGSASSASGSPTCLNTCLAFAGCRGGWACTPPTSHS